MQQSLAFSREPAVWIGALASVALTVVEAMQTGMTGQPLVLLALSLIIRQFVTPSDASVSESDAG